MSNVRLTNLDDAERSPRLISRRRCRLLAKPYARDSRENWQATAAQPHNFRYPLANRLLSPRLAIGCDFGRAIPSRKSCATRGFHYFCSFVGVFGSGNARHGVCGRDIKPETMRRSDAPANRLDVDAAGANSVRSAWESNLVQHSARVK